MAPTANIWYHFEKHSGNTGVAKCLLCHHDYSYRTSTTNLKKHLQHKHALAYQSYLRSPPTNQNIQVKTENQLPKAESPEPQHKDMEVESDSSISISHSHPSMSTSTDSEFEFQTELLKERNQEAVTLFEHQEIDVGENQKKLIDNQLLRMITQNFEPFSIVEDEGFREFVEALNPSYVLPDRKFISGTLIPAQYLECKNIMIELVQQAKKVCISTESWTSMNMDEYLTVTAHFLIEFELKSVLLHCEHLSSSHTDDMLAAALKTIAEQWKITNKITLAVSDDAPNITSAIHKTGWPFFGCFLHKLNLIIEKAIEVINLILDKVKTIVSHFEKSNGATEALEKYQIDYDKKSEALQLIQSVAARWNSVFYMLERFSKLQGALQNVLPKLNANLPVITVEMWEAISQVCMILNPFEEITRMSDTRYLTGSLAIIIVDGLRNVINVMKTKPIYGVAKQFLTKLEEGLNTYFPEHEIEDNMILGVCTFLDPRFKIHAFLSFLDESEQVAVSDDMCRADTRRAYLIKEHILELLKTKLRAKRKTPAVENVSVEYIETYSIWGKIDKTIAAHAPSGDDISTKAKNELDMFLNEATVPRDSSPLSWWKAHALLYPNLAEIFHEHCHIVVTSVEFERVFTEAGDLMKQKRSRLSRKRTAELVFLNSNEDYNM